jgi:crossover junction endodeoxyribonuclease RusA
MNPLEIMLPWPPSVNTYWRMVNGRMLISKDGRDYRKNVADQIEKQRAQKHFDGPLRLTVEAHRPDNRRRDLDNLLKATLDSLAHAGVYEDDSQIRDLRIYWAQNIGGFLWIYIEEML